MIHGEEVFQRLLDENPGDHVARLVFADFLDEHDDPRAEGYRALGRLRLRPYAPGDRDNYARKQWSFAYNNDEDWVGYRTGEVTGHHTGEDEIYTQGSSVLPWSWLSARIGNRESIFQARAPSRRAVEDGAALSWASLSEEQKSLFLSTEYTPT